jgi:thioredoxin-related protein
MKSYLSVIAALAMCGGAIGAEGWLTDFEKAKETAKTDNRHMLIDFSGSDWCGWCIKLDKEVFTQKAFQDYAKDNLVLMLADFPNDKSKQSAQVQKQNKKLADEFGVRGFPTVFVLSPEGKVVGRTGYQPGGPEAYVKHIKDIIEGKKE